jgi:protocatechuate 3,4-dioxygenase alpha subunit
MSDLKESPSQTAGPYVHIGCAPQTAGLEQRSMGPQLGMDMITNGSDVKGITLDITVMDGAGDLVNDALIEIWQATPDGQFVATNTFANWGRQASDLQTGSAVFRTFKPGAPQGQAPHILVWIVARGINLGLITRIYFPDEENVNDAVLALAADRAASLIATKTDTGYAHVIRLQGPQETVFFDV